jgi:E3 ubiquitin-protein ligase TRIP12
MTSLSIDDRRDFLRFITGSPKLPIGGFKGLNPSLTIVRRTVGENDSPDSTLPSVMTCANYLKVPEYSSREVLDTRFRTAIKEGRGSFHLS